MSSDGTPTNKFKASLTTRGINNDTLVPSIAMLAPVLFVYQLFLSPMLVLLVGALTWFFIMIPLLEYLQEKVPRYYVVHLLLWLTAGKRLEVTRDPLPLPLVIEPEWEQAREQSRAEQHKLGKTNKTQRLPASGRHARRT